MKLPTGLIFTAIVLASGSQMPAATVSPLFARGYTVVPTPQRVTFGAEDFTFSSDWRIEIGKSVAPGDPAVEGLRDLLKDRFELALNQQAAKVIALEIVPGTVTPERTRDKNTAAIAAQAYRLTCSPGRIRIAGNSATGLYYGVQTFVQLLKRENGQLLFPQVDIEDWPDLELRTIYWDDAHHLERLPVLKQAIRQASFYKINGFAIKLEGHFEYAHARAIVEPQALTPAEFQELTDYGLAHHVQVIPYLDGPAHDAFILKHPEYSKLREFPDSNYEFCATNPDTYRLFEGMFDDLLAANKGGKYFVLSTDEPYYVGLAHNAQCNEADRAKQLGSVGKMLAEFIDKTARYLHDRGRTVIFWGEYPLKPDDIGSLPPYLINGEVYGPDFDPVFRKRGIRQMIYTYTEAEEQMFPQYYLLPSNARLHPSEDRTQRVQEMLDSIALSSGESLSSEQSASAQPEQAELMGVFVAGWADAGLHPETFWRGYVTGPAAGWHSGTSAEELSSSFDALFYGSSAANIGRVYQLMSEGAQFWEDSWETGPSAARKPIWGDSYSIFATARPARDQFLEPLPVPALTTLRIDSDWRAHNSRRLELTSAAVSRNDELLDLLLMNLRKVSLNRYNLEVFVSIADLYRQNLRMLLDLGQIAATLEQASPAAAKGQAKEALQALDRALDLARGIREERNRVLRNATEIWYRSWLPRVSEANGRRYLDELDDVKDHQPARTVDMSYLVYRELLYPMDGWFEQVLKVRNDYAQTHNLPARTAALHWKEVPQ
jgi:hexosaminidase